MVILTIRIMEVYRSIDLYSRPVIYPLGLAYGLADTPFNLTLYAIYTFLFTLNLQLIDINYKVYRANITLKLSSSSFKKL